MKTDTLNRKEKMKKLRDDGKTLQEIADIYSISRERVRQIIGNTGGGNVKSHLMSMYKIESSMTTIQASRQLGGKLSKFLLSEIRKTHHVCSGGNAMKGNVIEKKVSEILSKNGFENELMPLGHPFDILLKNGIRIDVKSAYKKTVTSKTQKNEMYKFSTKANIKDECDFFICVIVPHDAIFIIPKKEVYKSTHLYISYPEPKSSWAKWFDFEDRFDLLRKYETV